MNIAWLALGMLVGILLGAFFVLARGKGKLSELQSEKARLETSLEHERRLADDKLKVLAGAQEHFKDAFKSLSADALATSSASFLQLAKETLSRQQVEATGELEKREQAVKSLVDPLSQSLEKVRLQIEAVEKKRAEDYGGLSEQLKAFAADQARLRLETGHLVQALRKPSVRGQWGEIQLRRVVELAGMLEHCDFEEQVVGSGEGGARRPDLIVHLPAGKTVIVDAKTPLEAYLDALETEDESKRAAFLARHAQQVRDHITGLSKKSYWEQFETSPEFVIMFLPSESVFYAALEQDPGLIEKGVDQKVILATPTTLIALLRTVHYGWRQEALAENAQKISALGSELYDRLKTLAEHFQSLGRRLDTAVESYNNAMGSLEGRVLVSARRFPELGVGGSKEMPELSSVDRSVRRLQSPEMRDTETER